MTCTTAAELLAERQTKQRMDITDAIDAATTAVNAVGNMSSAAQVSAADMAVAAAKQAIANAADVPDEEKAANTGTVAALETVLATAKTARMAYIDKMQSEADKAMMATAMKLHSGIVARNTADGENERNAAYSGTGDAEITVSIGATDYAELKEDKKTTVADLHGWEGKKYMLKPTAGGMVEAVVYSNIGEPTQGDKFGQIGVTSPATGYEYGLDANGFLTEDTTEGTASRIASSMFDQSAGVKSFKKADNLTYLSIAGTYHGVSGTYRCTPSGTNTCAVQKAAQGFNLGGVSSTTDASTFATGNATWIFKPANPESRVMSAPDTNYASYGWWLHTEADGDLVASAFTDNKGDAPADLAIGGLRGTATYTGGAAGKYALYSATGGTNDAGHFTARAMLKATFAASGHTISGTIDNFMGAGGEKDWSVKLNETDISNSGLIDGLGGSENNVEAATVWTIDGTAAAKSGQWRGQLQEAGDGGVPQVGTGSFYTEYSTGGKMVGAFGVTEQ